MKRHKSGIRTEELKEQKLRDRIFNLRNQNWWTPVGKWTETKRWESFMNQNWWSPVAKDHKLKVKNKTPWGLQAEESLLWTNPN